MSYIFCMNESSLTILTFYNRDTTGVTTLATVNPLILYPLFWVDQDIQDIAEKQLFYLIYTKPTHKIDSFLFTILTGLYILIWINIKS